MVSLGSWKNRTTLAMTCRARMALRRAQASELPTWIASSVAKM
jgi:hypothetical protein